MSAPVTSVNDTDYINSTEYDKLSYRLKNVVSVMDTLMARNTASRRIRYTEIDIEAKRASGEIGADEVFVPQHIIDTNIRREQASYIQYLTQSQRACIFQCVDDVTLDTTYLEKDFTNRVRYNDWQIPMFANIDSFQQNGYSAIEMMFDESKPGNIAYDDVQMGDLGFSVDTKDIQQQEMVARNYYFSKTELVSMSSPSSKWEFDPTQTEKVYNAAPAGDDDTTNSVAERSLFKIQKVMFRIEGIVYVAWACSDTCDNWIRKPRPLFLGRKKAVVQQVQATTMIVPPGAMSQVAPPPVVTYEDEFETQYPYYIFPYLISENNTLDKLKGRAYLDQDTQTAVTSMFSSIASGYRRASMMLFSQDAEDPNPDAGMKANVQFKNGAILPNKLKQFQLQWPDPSALNAVMALVTSNQAETSKVNFAAMNRKDSRKTAEEVRASSQEGASLSTVQVVLFSTACKKLYTVTFDIVQTRVAAGLIQVDDRLKDLYSKKYSIRPAGDVDVIERQQTISMMMNAWGVIQNTPAAGAFLSDILSKMFPEQAPKYVAILQQAEAQKNSQEAQAQQAMMQQAVQIGKQLITLSGRPEMFSEAGKIHVLPAIQNVAQQLSNFIKPE